MFKILLIDQFVGPSPYELSQQPVTFEALCTQELAKPHSGHGTRTQVLEVDDTYRQPFATTTFREGEDGLAEVWRYRWDSSG